MDFKRKGLLADNPYDIPHTTRSYECLCWRLLPKQGSNRKRRLPGPIDTGNTGRRKSKSQKTQAKRSYTHADSSREQSGEESADLCANKHAVDVEGVLCSPMDDLALKSARDRHDGTQQPQYERGWKERPKTAYPPLCS